MVLGNKNGNNKPRACSNDENIPLHISTARTLAHRLRGSAEVARRYGRPNNVRPTPSAIRRGKRKLPTTPLSVQVGVTDVQRVENPVTPQGAQMSLISVARHLIRPEFEAIDPESIKDHVKDIDADVTKVPLDVLKMTLNSFAPQYTKSLSSVTILQRQGQINGLPNEIDVLINESTFLVPTHLLAVTNTQRPSCRGKVQLYPIHSLVLATQCTRMPAFPPTPTRIAAGQRKIKLPVFVLNIPHPESFRALLIHLYVKDPFRLVRDLMPLNPPPTLFSDPSQVSQYASKLAMTFTGGALINFSSRVHGLWQNSCAFGVDDDLLWMVIETLWEVYISALTISTRFQQPAPVQSTA